MTAPPEDDDETTESTRQKRRWPWQKKRSRKTESASLKPATAQEKADTPQPVTPAPPPKKKEPRRTSADATTGKASRRRTSLFTRSKRFQKICDAAFELTDLDGNGTVDEKEFYAGLLLIHLKLGMYAGPAACKPLDRARCEAMFRMFDVDDSGHLSKDEFRQVMMVLFGNVFLRVLVQWAMTIMIVPYVARRILEGIYLLAERVVIVITHLDEYSSIADYIEVSLENAWAFLLRCIPAPVLRICSGIGNLLEKVPDSAWNALPLALISVVLSIVVVPIIIFRIDDAFQYVADYRAASVEKDSKKNR